MTTGNFALLAILVSQVSAQCYYGYGPYYKGQGMAQGQCEAAGWSSVCWSDSCQAYYCCQNWYTSWWAIAAYVILGFALLGFLVCCCIYCSRSKSAQAAQKGRQNAKKRAANNRGQMMTYAQPAPVNRNNMQRQPYPTQQRLQAPPVAPAAPVAPVSPSPSSEIEMERRESEYSGAPEPSASRRASAIGCDSPEAFESVNQRVEQYEALSEPPVVGAYPKLQAPPVAPAPLDTV